MDRSTANARLDEILARPRQGPGRPEACDNHGPGERCLTCVTDDELQGDLTGSPEGGPSA